MQQYPDGEVRQLVELAGFEHRTREFKGAFAWGDPKANWIQECTVRAILGLHNTPTGGQIIIGIEDPFNVVGLSIEQLASFKRYEAIKGNVDSYSTVAIGFEIRWGNYHANPGEQSYRLVVISVPEFQTHPSICSKDGRTKKLLKGHIYCRSIRGAAETVPVGEAEMQEIITSAVDKGIQEMRRRGYIGGITSPDAPPSDRRQFDQQIADLEI